MRRKYRGMFKFLYTHMSLTFNNISFETQAVSNIALSNILNAVLVRNNIRNLDSASSKFR